MTPSAHLDEFVRHLRVERGLSPCTWTSYGYQIRGYLRFLEGRGRIPASATREDVLGYLEARKDAGVTGSTLFAAAIAVRGFHRYLAAQGHASADPTAGMRLPKYKQRLPEPLSVDEMERLLSMPTGNKFHLVRMKAALEVLYSTGCRVSELLNIKLEQLHIEEGWVRVIGKGNEERVLPVGPRAKEALLRYLEARKRRFPSTGDTLFLTTRGGPISRTTFWWQLRQLARRAGLSGRVFPHQFRHGAATCMLEGGADIRVVQEMLGHRSLSTTMIYTHVSQKFLRRACEKAHPAWAG